MSWLVVTTGRKRLAVAQRLLQVFSQNLLQCRSVDVVPGRTGETNGDGGGSACRYGSGAL